jgi:hypothetical protein
MYSFPGGLPWNEVFLQLSHLPGETHIDLPTFTDISNLLHSATWSCSMLAGLAEGDLLSVRERHGKIFAPRRVSSLRA